VKLSVVVPCYNEQEALPQTASALEQLMLGLVARDIVSADSNVWLIDDGSTDGTWALIEILVSRSELFVGVKLSRNRGQQNALLAGLLTADGDAIVSVDADLQDDLGAIESMVATHRAGYEIVYGVRKTRPTDTRFKRWSALAYYRLLQAFGVEIVPNHADFRLLGRDAINALASYPEVNLFLRGIIPQLGFRCTSVLYERQGRIAGDSKYRLREMVWLGLDGITSFSAVPLRMIAALGGIVCLASIAMVIWIIAVRLFTTRALPGWASTTVPIYLLGGLQLLSLGIVGEYVSKIYSEIKRRPRFLIERIERRRAGAAVATTRA
jgi:glycosyltransferase involved in cell wall biosynthesis